MAGGGDDLHDGELPGLGDGGRSGEDGADQGTVVVRRHRTQVKQQPPSLQAPDHGGKLTPRYLRAGPQRDGQPPGRAPPGAGPLPPPGPPAPASGPGRTAPPSSTPGAPPPPTAARAATTRASRPASVSSTTARSAR